MLDFDTILFILQIYLYMLMWKRNFIDSYYTNSIIRYLSKCHKTTFKIKSVYFEEIILKYYFFNFERILAKYFLIVLKNIKS